LGYLFAALDRKYLKNDREITHSGSWGCQRELSRQRSCTDWF
jgi:hypothetical protein